MAPKGALAPPKAEGMNTTQILKRLNSKGLTPTEIQDARDQLARTEAKEAAQRSREAILASGRPMALDPTVSSIEPGAGG